MDLIAGFAIDGLCIASSDSDFAALAARARRAGLKVHGFGKADAANPFRRACSHYLPISAETPAPTAKPPAETPAPTPSGSPPDLAPFVRLIQNELADGQWRSLSELGQKIRKIRAGFKPGDFGSSSLSKLLVKAGGFELETSPPNPMRVRLAPVGKRKAS